MSHTPGPNFLVAISRCLAFEPADDGGSVDA